MTTHRDTYPPIQGVEPDLMKETFILDLPNYPDIETYSTRGIYKFPDYDLTVTIKPHIPDNVFQNSAPEDITAPKGWKIMVNDLGDPLSAGDGNTLYQSPEAAIRAIQNASDEDFQSLREVFDK